MPNANNSKYDKYFYFRTAADEDDDDGSQNSLMLPMGSITGIGPVTGITNVRIHFSQYGRNSGKTDRVGGQNSFVDLVVTRGKIKEVINVLVDAMSGRVHDDGITTVIDLSTTDFDGSTRVAKFLHNDITSATIVHV
tara:strand:+ start:58 stop:468 length:411 start_codon:yes stop_codon:yes gene_type:complete